MRYSRLLLALAVAPFAACNDDPTPPAADVDVVASGTSFQPAVLTLQPPDSTSGGEGSPLNVSVVWEFADGPHNIVFEDGSPGSGQKSDGTFEREFVGTNPSTYRYRCTIHSSDFTTGMVGSVVIQ
jgi:plastocyanin